MEILILLVWTLAVFFAFFLLLITALYKYFQQEKVSGIILRLGVALIGYCLATAATIPFFVAIVFAGENFEIGANLDTEEMLIYTAITAIYIGICSVLILFVKGSLFTWKSNETISVFE